MIIDEILDMVAINKKEADPENIIYILKEAEILNFDYIIKALNENIFINTFSKASRINTWNRKFKESLIKYIVNNDYNIDIIKDVFNINWITKNNYDTIKDYLNEKFITDNKNIVYVDK